MRPGDVVRFTTDQAVGHPDRTKIHIFLCKTDHFRAPAEYVFLFISSGDYGADFALLQASYPEFLTHDSFISCGNLVFYPRDYLEKTRLKKVGVITPQHLAELRSHLFDHEFLAGWQITVACTAIGQILNPA